MFRRCLISGSGLVFIGLIILFFTSCFVDEPSDGTLNVKIKLLNNTNYAPEVSGLIRDAEKTVELMVFVLKYEKEYSDSALAGLMSSLAEARSNGVKVRVLMDNESEQYTDTKTFFEDNDIDYVYDKGYSEGGVTTHTKMVIIDDSVLAIGSHNWTYSALERNNESSVVIHSSELAAEQKNYFDEIYESCRK